VSATEVLRTHSRTFGWATTFFGPEDRARVARLYAFCRVTDDIVDRSDSADRASQRLGAWRSLSRRAYAGEETGVDLVDAAMSDARDAEAPFRCVEDLLEGMEQDLGKVRLPDLDALWLYGYRVAGVVGEWMLHLFGLSGDAVRLARAHDMGRALQLTNILRDVGEDLRRDRIYLPSDLLEAHDVDEALLRTLQDGEDPVPDRYRALLERLMALADRRYRLASEALAELPESFARPVRIAAAMYRGIHDEIRRNEYDNLRRRASTSGLAKLRLASGVWRRGR
jgi:phytoene synthase